MQPRLRACCREARLRGPGIGDPVAARTCKEQ